MSLKREATDNFRMMLITVVGQAFTAAGYTLEDSPVKQAGGMFRFRKELGNSSSAFIEFQLLYLPQTEWSGQVRSRFNVSLTRTGANPVRKQLSDLVVNDFGVGILPSASHWWHFHDTDSLGKALAEAGHLAIGYGMPWLSGDLVPPSG